uniref:Myb-like domain-containing protein n=1 Tax=Oryza glumipatula TaxID=40148 RepID=A0A0D9ZNS0_9ORYZ
MASSSPINAAAAAAAAARRVPPPCWTPDETLALARAYTARRLAVGRAHLTSADWAAVADAATPTKTARQCRHKVEKLRRRLRSKRRRPCPLLDAIDLLDGPSPSASPSQSPSPPPPASPPPLPPAPSSPPPKKRRLPDADADADAEDDGESDVVKALRAIGEGFLRAEQRRMEAARKTQQMRMEMALRHLDSQRRLMEALVDRIIDSLE